MYNNIETQEKLNNDSERDDSLDDIFLEFTYADTDDHSREISELYSYTEYNDFDLNVEAFKIIMQQNQRVTNWSQQDRDSRLNSVLSIMEYLELSDPHSRLQAARAALYLVQGCWHEALSVEQQEKSACENVLLLLQADAFEQFIALLQLEVEAAEKCARMTETLDTKLHMECCTMLRVVLSVLYTITETLRHEKQRESAFATQAIANFVNDINLPLRNGELLSCVLMRMIWLFSTGKAPHIPVKKVLLLLWKITLLGFGGSPELRDLRRQCRLKEGLPCFADDDTVSVAQCLSPRNISTGPLTDGHRMRRCMNTNEEQEILQHLRQYQDPAVASSSKNIKNTLKLPWRQKTYQNDLDNYVQEMQLKFLGFSSPAAKQNIAGLPQPIKESVAALQRHVYISLAHVQMQKEEQIVGHPFSQSECDVHEVPVELFYEALLPRMPEFMVALLKLLQATMPVTRTKTNIDLYMELRPKQQPVNDSQSTVMSFDTKRHKDIIVKAISALLLLYLKHFKLNHIYQFEFLAQCLMYGNCMPLIMRIVGQHPQEYVCAKNTVPLFEFPHCVLGLRENTPDENLLPAEHLFSWRNTFSCVNLLRVLNKLVKGKESRVMLLMLCKSASTLKKLLQLRNSVLQLYVLKLLKMQSRLQGRAWRKSNMYLMSAIYTHVRHRMQDNWAYGCDTETRPVDHQSLELGMRACIESFHMRRYPIAFKRMKDNMANSNFCFAKKSDDGIEGASETKTQLLQSNMEQLFDKLDSTEEKEVVLTEHFKKNYELWLEDEVYNKQIDWDAL